MKKETTAIEHPDSHRDSLVLERPKIVITIENEPLLNDLELPELLKDYKKSCWKLDEYSVRKQSDRSAITDVIRVVHADTVTCPISNDLFSATIVTPLPSSKLDMNELRTNLQRLGKLDAHTVAVIFAKSMKTVPRKPYVKISAPKGVLPASKRPSENEEE